MQARVVEEKLEVSVSDTGIGMAPEQIEHLFDLGSKSRHGTNGEKGSGLGLILCKEFLQLNKGEITARSIQNVGAEFCFTLPLLA